MPDPITGAPEGSPEAPLSPQQRILAMLEAEEGGDPSQRRRERPEGTQDDPSQVADDDLREDLGTEEEDLDLEDDDLPEGEDEFDDEEGLEDLEDDEGPDLHTVKVDGEEVQVEYEELIKGYSRQAHFTRQMQALRQEEQSFQQHRQAVMQEREQYKVLLTQLHQVLTSQSSGRTAEEWARLKETDPVGYSLAREEERDRQEKIRATELEFQQTQQRQAAEQEQLTKRQLAEEQQKLIQAVPEWKDPEKAREGLTKVGEYALQMGFSVEDVQGIVDHRTLLVLRDAAKYAELKAKKDSLRPGKRSVKSATPGKSKQPRPRKNRETVALRQRLKETGDIRDAAKAIAQFL